MARDTRRGIGFVGAKAGGACVDRIDLEPLWITSEVYSISPVFLHAETRSPASIDIQQRNGVNIEAIGG